MAETSREVVSPDAVTRLLPTGDEAGSSPGDRAFRPDVEGMRAVAILLVVLYHAGLSRLSGGFVGVDVFFVAHALGMPAVPSQVAGPHTTLLKPYDGATLSGRELIDVRATDYVGVRRVEIQLKGSGTSETVVYDVAGKIAYSKPIIVSLRNG